ncbi:uncharacterized protein ISCGN_014188 [Ixodes scapularis]
MQSRIPQRSTRRHQSPFSSPAMDVDVTAQPAQAAVLGRRTGLPIKELVNGRALRKDSDGRGRLSDYFPDEGTSALCRENVRNISAISSPVRTTVQRYLSSLIHVSPTEVTEAPVFCGIPKPSVNPTEATSTRKAPTRKPSTGSFFLRGTAWSTTAAAPGTNKVPSASSTSLSSLVRRCEKIPRVPKAAASSAKDARHESFEDPGAEAEMGEDKENRTTTVFETTREQLPAQRPRCHPIFFSKRREELEVVTAPTCRASTLTGETTRKELPTRGPRCNPVCFTTQGEGLKASPPPSPLASTRKQSISFEQARRKPDGQPVEALSSSSPQALPVVGVHKELRAKRKIMTTLETSVPGPLPGAAPCSLGDLGTRTEGDTGDGKQKRTATSLAEARLGYHSQEATAPQQPGIRPYRFFKSRQSRAPFLSWDPRNTPRTQAPLLVQPEAPDEETFKQKSAAAAVVHLAKPPRSVVSATSGSAASSATSSVSVQPEGAVAPQEDASVLGDSSFSDLSGSGVDSWKKLTSSCEADNPQTKGSLNLSPEKISHERRVFVKQRRDVELVDAEQRPVGEAAPMGLGLLASTDHVTMGILRLQPGVAKSYSETRDHDVILLATDNTVVVERTDTWELLTKNSSFYVCQGVPYSVRNISSAPAEVCFLLVAPC